MDLSIGAAVNQHRAIDTVIRLVTVHIVRVFATPDGRHGSPLAVVLEGRVVPDCLRLRLAGAIGVAETVYVDAPRSGTVRISRRGPSFDLRDSP